MDSTAKRRMRLIVNGKAASDPQLRSAISQLRDWGHPLEVRVTWEGGDAARYAAEAVREKVDVVIAAGGDGTVNEVAGGMLSADVTKTAMAVIPYGTANDFATGIGVLTGDPLSAMQLAAEGVATPIDIGEVNDRIFINVTSGGFGAEVTASTPPPLKKALGGAAYSLMGLVMAAKMNPYECRFTASDGTVEEGLLLILAVGNGRQCGGGYQVVPHALLNDGLLDVVAIHDVEVPQIGLVLSELMDLRAESNRFVTYRQVASLTLESTRPLQLNLDGEPYLDTRFQFEAVPNALPFILGPGAPLKAAES